MICDYGCGEEATHQFKNGKWCCSFTTSKCPAWKKRTSNSHKGKKLSEEHKRNVGKSIKGKIHSEETKKKISLKLFGKNNGMYGVKVSEETIKKLSKIRNGSKRNKETKLKMSRSQKGRKHTKETKLKMRLSAIKRLERNVDGQLIPNYNPEACKLIDEYGKQHNYNFQHAENGGEFYIKELGYWVDGYDKENNIVLEVDEPAHYDIDNNLKNHDVLRQLQIEQYLNCDFIRIKI